MEPIPSAVARSIEIELPELVEMVHLPDVDRFDVPLYAFHDDPQLLHDFLWYAIDRGKRVTIISGVDRRQPPAL